MYYDEERGVSGFMAGLLVGVLLGAGAALLAAPDSGHITRRRLAHAVRLRSAEEDDDELTGNLRAALRAGRRRSRR